MLEIGRPRSRMQKNFGRRWTGGGGLENSTTFMDVICVSPLGLKVDIVTVKEKAPSKMMLHVESSVFCL